MLPRDAIESSNSLMQLPAITYAKTVYGVVVVVGGLSHKSLEDAFCLGQPEIVYSPPGRAEVRFQPALSPVRISPVTKTTIHFRQIFTTADRSGDCRSSEGTCFPYKIHGHFHPR